MLTWKYIRRLGSQCWRHLCARALKSGDWWLGSLWKERVNYISEKIIESQYIETFQVWKSEAIKCTKSGEWWLGSSGQLKDWLYEHESPAWAIGELENILENYITTKGWIPTQRLQKMVSMALVNLEKKCSLWLWFFDPWSHSLWYIERKARGCNNGWF